MVRLQQIVIASLAVVLSAGLGGCGKAANKAAPKAPAPEVTTSIAPPTTQASSNDPVAGAAEVDTILQQVNTDLAAVDGASGDEQDPSQ